MHELPLLLRLNHISSFGLAEITHIGLVARNNHEACLCVDICTNWTLSIYFYRHAYVLFWMKFSSLSLNIVRKKRTVQTSYFQEVVRCEKPILISSQIFHYWLIFIQLSCQSEAAAGCSRIRSTILTQLVFNIFFWRRYLVGRGLDLPAEILSNCKRKQCLHFNRQIQKKPSTTTRSFPDLLGPHGYRSWLPWRMWTLLDNLRNSSIGQSWSLETLIFLTVGGTEISCTGRAVGCSLLLFPGWRCSGGLYQEVELIHGTDQNRIFLDLELIGGLWSMTIHRRESRTPSKCSRSLKREGEEGRIRKDSESRILEVKRTKETRRRRRRRSSLRRQEGRRRSPRKEDVLV